MKRKQNQALGEHRRRTLPPKRPVEGVEEFRAGAAPSPMDDSYYEDEDEFCPNCGGEGVIYMCLDEIGCIDPEGGCDLCERRCDWCRT